jgi:Bacteriophage tail sheath protein
MSITQFGQLNTAALVVPDLYVQIVPPQTQLINGVPTNVLGIVGVGSWGPVNSPTTAGNVAQAAAIFGPQQNRLNDLMTAVAVAVQQGANNFRLVRVTDGTDVAASIAVTVGVTPITPTSNVISNSIIGPGGGSQATDITFTSKYTGSFGNGITVTFAAGSAVGTWKVIVAAPGLVPEVFDNIGFGLAGNAFWVAVANAINNGTSALRGASQIIVATADTGTDAPLAGTYSLSGGTDGAVTITSAVMLGQDSLPRTGMFALRNTGASVAMLADLTDTTTFTAQIAYGISEGTYMIAASPSGDTISNAITTKAAAGVDSPWLKEAFGDWVEWLDTVNAVTRVISPQAFFAGELVALAPNQSTLNKQMQAIVGTQKSSSNQQYAAADLQQLVNAGLDVITNPVPGGAYFGARVGHNSSSNPLTNGDNYTRMTNFIASTLNAAMGKFIGQAQAPNAIGFAGTPSANANATLGFFLDNVQAQGLIGAVGGPPAYSVQIDTNNNTPQQVALGFLTATVLVQYQAIIEKFLINVQGGTSVTIQRAGVSLI